MNDHGRKKIAAAIQRLHGVPAPWVETVQIHEIHEGEMVWEGAIEVYTLEGHPEADRCYAWVEPPAEDGGHSRIYAVLGVPPIGSAVDAVRTAILERYHAEG